MKFLINQTFVGHSTWVFFTDVFGVTEFFLLAAMSYDRYVAICKPLHYVTLMNSRVCQRLVLCCWISGLLIILPPLILFLNLKFCDSNIIDYFFCDASPILKISCSNTWLIEQLVIVSAVLTFILTLVCVVLSYIYIIKTILRLLSAQQSKRAFFNLFFSYDCGFHHLWNLYLHLHQTFSKRISGY